jgi:CRP-like cAMP-binding protein
MAVTNSRGYTNQTRRPLSISQLDSRASPRAFGYGRSLEAFGGGAGPEGYGSGLRVPTAGPEGYGAVEAEQLQQVGQIADRWPAVVFAVERRDQTIRGRTRLQGLRRVAAEQYSKWQAEAPVDANHFTKSTMERYDKWTADQVEPLTGIERSIVEEGLADYGDSLYSHATEFEAGTKRKYYETALNDSVEIARNTVFLDPGEYERELGDLTSTIEESDLPESAKYALVSSAASSLTQSLWQRRVRDDPINASAVLLSQEIPHLSAGDRLTLANGAESEMRQQESERRIAESEARQERRFQISEGRAAKQDARDQLRDQREEAEASLTAGILDGSKSMADVTSAVGSRLISGDQARVLSNFATQRAEPQPDAPLAVSLMLRAGQGDPSVINDAADAAAHGRIPIEQLRQVTNDFQEFQRQGGPFTREDVKLGEDNIRRVLEEDGGLGLDAGGKAEKSFAAIQMYRRHITEDPKGDPLELANRVIDVWKQGAGKAPRPRYLVQPPGGKPDIAASAQATIDALHNGEIDEQEAALQAEALEIYQREMERQGGPWPK